MRALFTAVMGSTLLALSACSAPVPHTSVPSPIRPLGHDGTVPSSPLPVSASPVPSPAWPPRPEGTTVLYLVNQDPDRPRFITDPASQKMGWQLQLVRLRTRTCQAAMPAIPVTVTLWFLDDRQAHWFPSVQTLSVRCGATVALRPSLTRDRRPGHWLFQPEPSFTGSAGPDGIARPQPARTDRNGKLPMTALWIHVTRPVTLTVRWRSQALDRTVSPWTTRTLVLPAPVPATTVPASSDASGVTTGPN